MHPYMRHTVAAVTRVVLRSSSHVEISSRLSRRCSRHLRSFSASTAADVFEDPRKRILDASLNFVNTEGWTQEALAAGAVSVGYPAVSQGLFSRGPVELAYHLMDKANIHMANTMTEADLASLSVNERIKLGVKARLMYLAPYMRCWAQAMALGIYPSNVKDTLYNLAVMVDEIWWQAGDRSSDLNWYTRRLLLLGVYTATETFMLTDKSDGFVDTWEFLDRRLTDVATFGRQAGETLSVASAVAGGVGSLATAAFDLIRPLALAPGKVLPQVSQHVNEAFKVASATTGLTSGSSLVNVNTLANMAAPALGVAGSVLNSIGAAAQRAGITLPQPPPLLASLLQVASTPAPVSTSAPVHTDHAVPPFNQPTPASGYTDARPAVAPEATSGGPMRSTTPLQMS